MANWELRERIVVGSPSPPRFSKGGPTPPSARRPRRSMFFFWGGAPKKAPEYCLFLIVFLAQKFAPLWFWPKIPDPEVIESSPPPEAGGAHSARGFCHSGQQKWRLLGALGWGNLQKKLAQETNFVSVGHTLAQLHTKLVKCGCIHMYACTYIVHTLAVCICQCQA